MTSWEGVACWLGVASWAGEGSRLGVDSRAGVAAEASPEGVDSRAVVDSWAGADSWVLDRGVSEGGCKDFEVLEDPEEVPERCRAAVERWALLEAPTVPARLNVLPGNALAATAVSTPVSVALPAISQRLQRLSRRSAASRERGVCRLSGISIGESSGEARGATWRRCDFSVPGLLKLSLKGR